ncbi:putative transposase [Escherichia coli]|uniref:Putative transposase n=1 Tax=Escherichia coli TaxID=562 RepID=A0A376LDL1_ECOLX|nr:putative transposase [Escherichia coli]
MWLREQMQQTSQCWTLKELAKNIWDRPWSTERRNDWLQWISLASECDVPMMKNAAKTIKKTVIRNTECNASSRLEWKCGGAEQQDQTAEDKGQGIPKPGTL